MVKLAFLGTIVLASVISFFGQSTPTPSPTPAISPTASPSPTPSASPTPTASLRQGKKGGISNSPPVGVDDVVGADVPSTTLKVMPTPPLPSPTPDAEPSDKGWSVTGGIDFVSRYHGSNGQRFGGADQNIYGEGNYRFNPKFALYCGTWYAIQFKELDLNCGARVETGKVSHDVQYQLIYLLDGKIPIHNFNYDISTSVFKNERFSAAVFARFEYYGTRKKDNIRPGSYIIGGVRTDTELGKGWNFSFSPRVLWDIDGVFDVDAGTVFLVSGEITKKFGKFTMGPGFKYSQNVSTNDRPKLFTVSWTISF